MRYLSLLKQGGISVLQDMILHILDRACLLVLFFACGMVQYALMYGTAILYVLAAALAAAAGILFSRLLIGHAIGSVRTKFRENHALLQAERDMCTLCDTVLTVLFLFVTVPSAALPVLLSGAAAGVLVYLLRTDLHDAKAREAAENAVLAGAKFLAAGMTLFLAMAALEHGTSDPDQASAALLAVLSIMPENLVMKADSPLRAAAVTFYGLSEAAMCLAAAMMVSGSFVTVELPAGFYGVLSAAAAVAAIASAAFLPVLSGKKHRFSLSAALACLLPCFFFSASAGILPLVSAAAAALFRTVLFPVLAAAVSQGKGERESGISAFSGVLTALLVSVMWLIVYLRTGCAYQNMTAAQMMFLIWTFGAPAEEAFRTMRQRAEKYLAGEKE